MKRLILTTLQISLIAIAVGSSQNLVKNYSFENYNETSCEIADAFNSIMVDWDSPNSKQGDVFFTNIDQECYYYQPNSTYGGPIGLKGTELPSDGDVFAGIWVYTIEGLNQREYVRGQLMEPVEKGNTYRVQLKFSLADYMESYVGELGILFTESLAVTTNGDLIVQEPQLTIQSDLDRSLGWVDFDTSFVSDGDYAYFIIGNFKSDDDTERFPNPKATGAVSTYGAYYFLDEVSVELETTSSIQESDYTHIEVFPNPVHDHIHVRINSSDVESYEIVNHLGIIMKKAKLETRNEASLDTSFLNPGMYYLVCYGKNRMPFSSSKFVKF